MQGRYEEIDRLGCNISKHIAHNHAQSLHQRRSLCSQRAAGGLCKIEHPSDEIHTDVPCRLRLVAG